MKQILLGLSLLFALASANVPSGCSGVLNTSPTLTLTPTPLRSVANGQSWKIDSGDGNVLYVAKVSGTPYEMGFALG
jgi:hypothetical protein